MAFDHGEGFVTFSANGYSVKHRASDIANAKKVWFGSLLTPLDVRLIKGTVIRVLRRVGVGAALLGIPGPLELRARELQQKRTGATGGECGGGV